MKVKTVFIVYKETHYLKEDMLFTTLEKAEKQAKIFEMQMMQNMEDYLRSEDFDFSISNGLVSKGKVFYWNDEADKEYNEYDDLWYGVIKIQERIVH